MVAMGGCAVAPPSSPGVVVLPGSGKSYEAFQADDGQCRAAAAQSVGYRSPQDAANQSAIGSAVVGTALGAAAGAALGAAAGNPGAGAAIGAGSGLLMGSAVGADNAQMSAAAMQQHYDVTYMQCMSAKGNKVPDVQTTGNYPPPPGPDYSPYSAYPPPYAYYPDYGYLYAPAPPIVFSYGWGYHGGWGGGDHWHHH
jgi:hypothetical protein